MIKNIIITLAILCLAGCEETAWKVTDLETGKVYTYITNNDEYPHADHGGLWINEGNDTHILRDFRIEKIGPVKQ